MLIWTVLPLMVKLPVWLSAVVPLLTDAETTSCAEAKLADGECVATQHGADLRGDGCRRSVRRAAAGDMFVVA